MSKDWTPQIMNDDLVNSFRTIVTAGWANKSDGDVASSVGHFALVTIEPAELNELVEACLEDGDAKPMPGYYIVNENQLGLTFVFEFISERAAQQAFRMGQREYAIWNATCPKCENEGPHDRLKGNLHRCCCGEVWDPTEGI